MRFFSLENTYDAYNIMNHSLKLEKAFVYKLVAVSKKTLAIQFEVHKRRFLNTGYTLELFKNINIKCASLPKLHALSSK